jgi:hypothetical protein
LRRNATFEKNLLAASHDARTLRRNVKATNGNQGQQNSLRHSPEVAAASQLTAKTRCNLLPVLLDDPDTERQQPYRQPLTPDA